MNMDTFKDIALTFINNGSISTKKCFSASLVDQIKNIGVNEKDLYKLYNWK